MGLVVGLVVTALAPFLMWSFILQWNHAVRFRRLQRIVPFARGKKFLGLSGECPYWDTFDRLKGFNRNIDENGALHTHNRLNLQPARRHCILEGNERACEILQKRVLSERPLQVRFNVMLGYI